MRDNYSPAKTFLLGAIIGGAVGAVTALLFAPKSGRELRRDIADTTNEIYDKTTDFVSTTIQDGKQKAQSIIDAAKRQADSILAKSSDYYEDAKGKVVSSAETVQQRFDNLKEAAKAGADAFKADLSK
ncbi:MAG: YtxH domain-containing protein [Ignavibacteria bacterium]|jgi:gas vesicle protein|nr:YtxH domain-containing protein [Ignavibacteria bacterium]